MNIELEEKMNAASQLADMKKKKKEKDVLQKAVKRECAILVTWLLLFVMRYLKLIFLDGIICLDKWFYYDTVYKIESAVGDVVFVLNIVVFILWLYDFIKIEEIAESWSMIFAAVSWIFFRPIYLIVRGIALKNNKAIVRGGVWCFIYCLALSYYVIWYFEVLVTMIATCG